MDNNRIVTIPSECFKHNKKLRTINLSSNHLRSIAGLFSDLPSLESLDLQRNYLLSISDDVFAGSGRIKTLSLSHNNLYQVADLAFKPLQQLTELRLDHNFLSAVSEDVLRHNIALTTLSLDHNMIKVAGYSRHLKSFRFVSCIPTFHKSSPLRFPSFKNVSVLKIFGVDKNIYTSL